MSVCDCGFSDGGVDRAAITAELLRAVDELCAELAAAPEAAVRRRPEPAVWSPLEYCCHLRDVLVTQRERVVRTLVEDVPVVLPMHRDERALLTRYAAEPPDRAAAQLRAVAEMAAWTFDSLDPGRWMRECVYNYPEPAHRSLEWVGRHALHEAVHHLWDVRRILSRAVR